MRAAKTYNFVQEIREKEQGSMAMRKVTSISDLDPTPDKPLVIYPGGGRKEFSLELTGIGVEGRKNRVTTYPGNILAAYENGNLIWLSAPKGTDAHATHCTTTETPITVPLG